MTAERHEDQTPHAINVDEIEERVFGKDASVAGLDTPVEIITVSAHRVNSQESTAACEGELTLEQIIEKLAACRRESRDGFSSTESELPARLI